MKLNVTATLLSWMLLMNGVCHAENDHDHESCACAAEEDGFVIDCFNQGATTIAELALAVNNCNTDCSTELCHRSYLVVQSHHDYCLSTEITSTLEATFHLFKDTCGRGCEIRAKANPSLPNCPQASCTDGSGNAAYAALVAAGCVSDCSSAACGPFFRTALAVHDSCPEGSLSETAEEGFHSIEEMCLPPHGCNALAGDDAENPLVCSRENSILGAIGVFISSILFCF